MKPILVLEHMDQPAPDAGLAHLADRGVEAQVVKAFKGEPLPAPETLAERYSGVIVMGGAQMVTDAETLPWMGEEIALMRRALADRLPMLCICLGAQMLAHALGGTVAPDPQGRIAWGFHEIRALPAADNPIPARLTVLSGNFQGFEIPEGAERLATTDGPWANQAFRYGSALALQFHPEVTQPILEDWQRYVGPHLHREGATDIETQNAGFAAHDPALKAWFRDLLDARFGLV